MTGSLGCQTCIEVNHWERVFGALLHTLVVDSASTVEEGKVDVCMRRQDGGRGSSNCNTSSFPANSKAGMERCISESQHKEQATKSRNVA